MNALELANILEKCVLDGSTNLVCVYDAVIMLRYLQAQIDTHKEQNSSQIDTHRYEPVAWVDGLCLALIHKCKSEWVKVYREKKDDEYIPLYDHPAKTYEDAIEECAQRAEAYAYMSPNFMALAEELRAILKKANEK